MYMCASSSSSPSLLLLLRASARMRNPFKNILFPARLKYIRIVNNINTIIATSQAHHTRITATPQPHHSRAPQPCTTAASQTHHSHITTSSQPHHRRTTATRIQHVHGYFNFKEGSTSSDNICTPVRERAFWPRSSSCKQQHVDNDGAIEFKNSSVMLHPLIFKPLSCCDFFWRIAHIWIEYIQCKYIFITWFVIRVHWWWVG